MKNDPPFPLTIKRGPCKVTIYAPTPALPFYRICYRVGGKRLQRIRKVFKEAEQEAHAILDKLDSGEVSIANITSSDVALLHTAKRELSDINARLDIAAHEYAQAI